MQRLLLSLVVVGSIYAAAPVLPRSHAQESPPAAEAVTGETPTADALPAAATFGPMDKWGDQHSIPRLDRPALSAAKFLVIGLIFLMWVKSADWVNRDTQIFKLGYGKWNPIQFFPFFLAILLLGFLLPNFLVAAVVLPVCYLATFVPYVLLHNKTVELQEQMFTSDWLRYQLASLGSKVGLKLDAERKAEYEKGKQVDLTALGADERTNQANLISARQSPGYLLAKELIADMADRRCDRSMLDYTQQSVVTRYHIDGVWHNGEARDRESGDVMLAVIKTLADLEMTERRKKQAGRFGAKYKDHSYICSVVSQGVSTGERVVVELLGGHRLAFKSYADLGMRQNLADQWAQFMGQDKGLLLIAGMPEGGVTTLTDISLLETDRLLRDFVSIEEEHHREREIENIEVTTYDATKGESPVTILPKLIRKYPNVYVLREFTDSEAVKLLFDEIQEDHLVLTNVHAKDASESLLRVLQLKVPQRGFASSVSAVLCTRLIRKLCDGCKVGYAPTPDLLQKLGIPAGKIEALYRVPKPEEIEKPCAACAGIGFYGRTAIFELLVVNDPIREILVKQPKLELLHKAARAAGMRSFQEEGLLLVAKGVTSLAELQRVLKL
ncbi:MAG: Flp pilus assembly complex ATPase component TadA [Planctomycetes bacterium]|nr:Flp pilus assembly complex ATPase component TadA [Planctomycetota bacterium]